MASTTRKVLTLVFIRNFEVGEVLLGLKKRGFGSGKWNGFGGKVEKGETIEEAAVREVTEECGLTIHKNNLLKTGEIDFIFEGDPVILEVHVFQCNKYQGIVTESEEMLPKWFPVTKMPTDKMWIDDPYWFPYVLEEKKFKATFNFQGHDKILSYDIKET